MRAIRPSIVLVTPALADANNGNWQTARRWARMLSERYRVHLTREWLDGREDLMIALHARRSAASIERWRLARPDRASGPLAVVLTGTDLYRDIAVDRGAQRSLALADALVTLNTLGPRRLEASLQAKCQVILQSCSKRQPIAKPAGRLRALMVGHLRPEKDPETFFRAARRLADRRDILFDHIGDVLDDALGRQARALSTELPNYRWLGARPHAETRRHIQHAHLLVHPSRMEGGAHVIIEAVRSGTPVLASRIDGNAGLLGEDYPGLFAPGDDAALAAELLRCRDDPARLAALRVACGARAPDFAPQAEAGALRALAAELLAGRSSALR